MTPPLAQQLAELRTALERIAQINITACENADADTLLMVLDSKINIAIQALANTAPPPAAEAAMNDEQRNDDRKYMGTKAEAEAKLLSVWRDWCQYQGPHIDTAKGHRKRENMAREAGNRMIDAAALLAWHLNDQATPATRRDDSAGGAG